MLLKLWTLRPSKKLYSYKCCSLTFKLTIWIKVKGREAQFKDRKQLDGDGHVRTAIFFPPVLSGELFRVQIRGKEELKEEGLETISRNKKQHREEGLETNSRNKKQHRGEHSGKSFTPVTSANACTGLCCAVL